MKIIVDILYANRLPRIYEEYSPTIRSERTGLLVIDEDIQMFKIPENRIRQTHSQRLRST